LVALVMGKAAVEVVIMVAQVVLVLAVAVKRLPKAAR